MGAVVAAVRRHHPAEFGEFGVLGVHAGGVGEPGRHADRALFHALGDQLPHPVQLLGCRLAVLPADGEHPDRALRDQVGRVDRDAATVETVVEAVQVLAHGPPVEVDVVAVAVPPGDRPAHLGQRAVVDGGVRQAVLADDFEGHPLCGLGAVVRVAEQRQVAVGVHVDEAGGEDQPLRVQLPPRLRALTARRRGLLHDRDDPPAVDHDIGAVRGRAGAVHDVRVPDHQLFHAMPPTGSGRASTGISGAARRTCGCSRRPSRRPPPPGSTATCRRTCTGGTAPSRSSPRPPDPRRAPSAARRAGRTGS